MEGAIKLGTTAAAIALASAFLLVSDARAAVTLGQLAHGPPTATCANPDNDGLNPTVTGGRSYVVPNLAGTITSWSHEAAPAAGQILEFKVFRLVGGLTWQAIAADRREMAPGTLNTFPLNIPVLPGDVIGLNSGDAGSPNNACVFTVPGQEYLYRAPGLAPGQQGLFSGTVNGNARMNVSAEFEPSNSVVVGAIERNRKRGTATITAQVPNPGELKLDGDGISDQALTITAPGTVALSVTATGAKRRALRRKGKARIDAEIIYTPARGTRAEIVQQLKLRRKKRS